MGKVALGACVYLAVHVMSYTSGVIAASMLHSSIVQAEESAKGLVSVLSDVKIRIRPRHCTDLLDAGQTVSGVYTTFLPINGDDIMKKIVYCDMDTDGGGWTVIQKRGQFGNNVYYFYRNWTEYAMGFGDASKEYWIGNNALHILTSGHEDMELKIVLTNHTGENVSIDYEKLDVGSEDELFKLLLGSYLGPPGWDALSYSNGFSFSTYDEDHDEDHENCAQKFRGGWWYVSCHTANLNGLNLNGQHESYADGIEWSEQGDIKAVYYYSYPSAYMMIRPAGRNGTSSKSQL